MMRSGADYLAAIARDGRHVLLDGALVEDVTSHPAFGRAAATIAGLYDAARDRPDLRADGEGDQTSGMWVAPRTPEHLALRHRVHRHWAEGSFGLMGRTPDHVAAIVTAFAASAAVFGRGSHGTADRVTAFYEEARTNDWFVTFAITPPQVDRSRPAHDQPEEFLYPGIVTERNDGIVIRGALMIATSAAIADQVLISSVAPLLPGDEAYAISVVVPVAAEGVRLHARRPYAAASATAFDDPLASRFDEPDCLIVLRDVFVPWRRVFIHRDVARVNAQFAETGASTLAAYQGLVQFGVKLELAAGLAIELADAHGLSAVPSVQAQLGGDVAAFARALDAIVVAATAAPVPQGTLLLPAPSFVTAGVSLQRRWIVDIMRALRELAGGGFIAMPSEGSFGATETSDDVRRYYRSATLSAHERVALLKVMWDLVGSEFAGRQLQYEMFSSAAQHIADRQVFRSYDWETGRAHVRRLLERD